MDFVLRFFVLLLLAALRQADAAAGRAAALAERAVGTCVLPQHHYLLLHIQVYLNTRRSRGPGVRGKKLPHSLRLTPIHY